MMAKYFQNRKQSIPWTTIFCQHENELLGHNAPNTTKNDTQCLLARVQQPSSPTHHRAKQPHSRPGTITTVIKTTLSLTQWTSTTKHHQRSSSLASTTFSKSSCADHRKIQIKQNQRHRH
mmetsp:Transcript_11215/g.24672  ORF Transcript_11215/g.24672 Transcript_11215/m.24672 type:complete len:120 (-) Transcript_11215:236-595(-)